MVFKLNKLREKNFKVEKKVKGKSLDKASNPHKASFQCEIQPFSHCTASYTSQILTSVFIVATIGCRVPLLAAVRCRMATECCDTRGNTVLKALMSYFFFL